MQHSIMECCIILIHLFFQGGHYEHDTTYPQQTAFTRFQRLLPYQTAQLPELHSHPDRSEHCSPHQRHPSSHLGRCLLHRTQPLLHPSPHHGKKTEKETRILINKELQETLLSYRTTQPSIADTDYLFPSPRKTGSPLSRYQAYRIVRKAAEAVGIEDVIRCHSLRKTFGYHAWKMGTPPALLMEIYNHSSFQITKHYLGIEQDDKDAVFRDIQL